MPPKNVVQQNLFPRLMALNRLKELKEAAVSATQNRPAHITFKNRYSSLDTWFSEFERIHMIIVAHIENEDEFEEHDKIRREADTLYNFIRDTYMELFGTETVRSPAELSSQSQSANVRLPKLNLRVFDGNLAEWQSYKDLYDVTVHNNDSLSNIEKYQYLMSTLRNEPLSIVSSVPFMATNYQIAYNSLTSRYQNKRLLATHYWNAINNSPSLSSDNQKGLRQLLDTFSENITALKQLAFPTDAWDFIMFNLLLSKLDPSTRKRFELQNNSGEIPTFEELKTFLDNQCKALETFAFEKPAKLLAHKPNQGKSPYASFASLKSASMSCVLCQDEHQLFKCNKFLAMTPSKRVGLVKNYNLCFNCLRTGHGLKSCVSKSSCKQCHAKHHTLLHNDRSDKPSFALLAETVTPESSSATSLESTESQNSIPEVNSLTTISLQKSVSLLPTALIEIKDARGNYQTFRCLIDSGSQTSFVTESCLHKLGLKHTRTSAKIFGLNQVSVAHTMGVVLLEVRSKLSNNGFNVESFVLPKICSRLPETVIVNNTWSHLKGLPLADPEFYKSNHISVLLGADAFPLILLEGVVQGNKPNEPVALSTIFGYVIIGKAQFDTPTQITSLVTTLDEQLDATLKRFWEIEQIPTKSFKSPDDTHCEELYRTQHCRDKSGRYVVALPFREDKPTFSNSRATALRRLYSLEQRFLRDDELRQAYIAAMNDYIRNGYMSESVPPDNSLETYYLPHHCVVRPDKASTRVRVVFDASCRSPGGASLNDCLYIGPKLQQEIFILLLRFRVHRIVFTCDIKQMYLQIRVAEKHQNYQRVLWRESREQPVKEYKLHTVTFGVASAPFLALRTIQQLISDEGKNFPRAAKILESDVFVDDIVAGCESLKEAVDLRKELTELLQRGQFTLHKWSSNCQAFMREFDTTIQGAPLSFDVETNNIIKVLGLQWVPNQDVFSYQVRSNKRPCTKRVILSELAKIFDPVGFLAPVSFFAKRLIQHMWTLGLDWDEKPPADVLKNWLDFENQLPLLSQIEINRRITLDKAVSYQLHGFCDASESGFGCVIYLRVQSGDSIDVHLICAKSKVSPLKRISLPRLELCAAVLLADLMQVVSETYKHLIPISSIWAWSDARVVLAWIKGLPHRFKTFVSNRVSRIQEKLKPNCWRHVRSQDNPADCLSRGLLPAELLNHLTWWAGPSWLSTPIESWSNSAEPCLTEAHTEYSIEERKLTFSAQIGYNFLNSIANKFSSLRRIQRIVAYCLRFIHNAKSKNNRNNNPLVRADLELAMTCLVRLLQQEYFKDEIENIRNKKLCVKQIQKLAPFIDDEGLLRVGGRLRNADLTYDAKHPLLLPRTHRLTELIVTTFHEENFHCGAQTLLYLISQRFWILSAQRLIKGIISKCIRCFKVNPPSLSPLMGNLPLPRVSQLKPFSHTGVDCAGPFTILAGRYRGAKKLKAYLCLFVCFATKALHLELVSDMSSNTFLAAFRRFIARKGRCSHMYSDQGTNFVGAKKLLTEALQFCKDAAQNLTIEWHFNPPAAPHFGGLWESGVKSVKTHLRRVIGDQTLTFEELYTVLVQIESLLNSRPLCSTSTDPNDLTALTPGHFLTLEPLTAPPDPDLSHIKLSRLDRWQLLQRMTQDFWKRWKNEYLHTLFQRNKWSKPSVSLKTGTLVVIKDNQAPPLQWQMARVITLHEGSDGVCRVATLQTSKGIFKRPIVKLCPLPAQ